jgi:hypothetical protein
MITLIAPSNSINLNTLYTLLRLKLPFEITDAKVSEISERILGIKDLNLNKLSISFEKRTLSILYEDFRVPFLVEIIYPSP